MLPTTLAGRPWPATTVAKMASAKTDSVKRWTPRAR
jgi:hypothetical protein